MFNDTFRESFRIWNKYLVLGRIRSSIIFMVVVNACVVRSSIVFMVEVTIEVSVRNKMKGLV